LDNLRILPEVFVGVAVHLVTGPIIAFPFTTRRGKHIHKAFIGSTVCDIFYMVTFINSIVQFVTILTYGVNTVTVYAALPVLTARTVAAEFGIRVAD
jgi:hypothetical protein